MSDCVFCDIVAERSPAYRLYEDERTLAFLDVAPATTGHALVVPNPHRETLVDMDDPEAAAVFRTVRRVASAVRAAFDPDGVNVLQANGAAAGQEVFHAHVHVVPRYEGDDLTFGWTASELTDEDGQDVARALRDELSN